MTVEIVEVAVADRDDSRLWGRHIDGPRPGSRMNGDTMQVVGWVLGRHSRAVAVELLHEGGVIHRTPVGVPRPDVQAAFPNVRDAQGGGFQTALKVHDVAAELELEAVLENDERVPIGRIRARVLPDEGAARGPDQPAPLPGRVGFGSLRRVTPISRLFGFDRGLPVDRYYIEGFLACHSNDVGGRVLEIEDDAYTRKFGHDRVSRADVLHVSAGNPRATIVADLAKGQDIPSDAFDCIILTQTLQLIYDVRAAVRTLHRILKPGGVLLATFPGISPIDPGEWGETWYWGFTALSAGRLFGEVFPAGEVEVVTYGNVLATVAFMHGLAAEELRREELDAVDPTYQLLIALRAVKPQGPVPPVSEHDRG